MVKFSASTWFAAMFSLFIPRGNTLWHCLALISILSILGNEFTRYSVLAQDFEGFGDEGEEEEEPSDSPQLIDLRFRSTIPPPSLTQSNFETHHRPPDDSLIASSPSDPTPKPSSISAFDYWDEEEFEGLSVEENPNENVTSSSSISDPKLAAKSSPQPRSYTVEIICISFLIAFIINFIIGKRKNENIALAWAAKFATKDSIFERNFSLLRTDDGKDKPLLLKEGQNVFKFYASGRRYCQGLLATMELQSRQDLISRVFNYVVPCKDEITFEVYMNDDAMDQVVFALAKKKAAKAMQKDIGDLQKFANLVSTPTNRKWVVEDLAVISESKEVAGDLITETVLDQESRLNNFL